MKMLFIFLIGFIPLSYSHAQIPNNDFETWNSGSTGENPESWMTTNAIFKNLDNLTNSVHPASVVKASPGYNESFGMTLRNVVGTALGVSIDTVPGIASAITNAGKEGFSITQRFNSLIGYYKFTQGGNGIAPKIDTSLIIITVSKWNENTHKREIIGRGELPFFLSTSTFTPFSISIEYSSSMAPDSAQITIMSSSSKKRFPGTSLTIDQISLGGGINSGAAGLKKTSLQDIVQTYPNPARSEINISNIPKEASAIELRDLSGKKIHSTLVDSDFINIKTHTLSSGMYIYSIVSKTGEIICINKITIEN
jgi:hypothetical protein